MPVVAAHHRWKFGPVSGAVGSQGGHWKALGFTYTWLMPYVPGPEWDTGWTFDLFDLLHVSWKQETGIRWALAAVSLQFEPARFRRGKREEARERRRARRRHELRIAAHLAETARN